MDMIIPPLTFKIMLESSPLKSTILVLVRRLAVRAAVASRAGTGAWLRACRQWQKTPPHYQLQPCYHTEQGGT